MHLIKKLLLPFSWIYGLILSIRHGLFNSGILGSRSVDIPTIVVGNLALGGSGKSPVTIYLTEWLSRKYKVAVLSRGYGRSTKGFRVLGDEDTSKTVGDEALQVYKRSIPNVIVAVGEDRVAAIQKLQQLPQAPDIVILDDAMQHRKLKAGLYLLLSACATPFVNEDLFPAGNLRDLKSRARIADLILWTKCEQEMQPRIAQKAKKYSNAPQFSAGIVYGEPKWLQGTEDKLPERVISLCGIAMPEIFHNHNAAEYNVVETLSFSDHHEFSKEDIEQLSELCKRQRAAILTTEKDAMRFSKHRTVRKLKLPILYIPISLKFHSNEDEFRNIVKEYLNQTK